MILTIYSNDIYNTDTYSYQKLYTYAKEYSPQINANDEVAFRR